MSDFDAKHSKHIPSIFEFPKATITNQEISTRLLITLEMVSCKSLIYVKNSKQRILTGQTGPETEFLSSASYFFLDVHIFTF